jgi:hypothetical protein
MWTAGVAAESSAKQGFPFVGPAHWVAQNGPDSLTDSPPGPGGYRTRRIVPPLAQAPDCTISLLCATTDQQMACLIPTASLEWPYFRPSEVMGEEVFPGFVRYPVSKQW